MAKSLTTEPLSSRQRWYREVYLRSDHWRALRATKFKQSPRCHMCDAAEHLDVHHASYERIGAERLSDLITLCRGCHTIEHTNMSAAAKIAVERAIMEATRFRQDELRQFEREQRRKPKKKRQRKTDAFVNYAFHCLRAIRRGFATPQEYDFIRRNRSDIARLRV